METSNYIITNLTTNLIKNLTGNLDTTFENLNTTFDNNATFENNLNTTFDNNLYTNSIKNLTNKLITNLTTNSVQNLTTNLIKLTNLDKSNYLMSLTLNNIKSVNYNLDTNIVNSNLNNTFKVQTNQFTNLECSNSFRINNSALCQNNFLQQHQQQLQNDSELLNEFAMPFIQQLIWSLIFSILVLFSCVGNCIICWIILFHKRMRSVTNMYLLNLSIADTMVSTLNVLFNFTYMLNTDWKFGTIYCKISNFIAVLSVSASVWSLAAISIDRFRIIIYPLKTRISKFCTIIITVSIWILSSILSLPNIIYSTTDKQSFKNNSTRTICYLVFPDGESSKSNLEYIYNIIILLTTYCIPISGMTYAYFRIGIVLWSSKSIGECCTDKQLESIKSKRKIVKMMIVVCLIFAICFLPYHLYFLLTHHFPSILDSPNTQHIYLAIYALAMSHSMSNPLILCWMNSRFRAGFRSVFCCVCLRGETVKERYKQKYKKKSQYSANECQTNQTRIRCTTITGYHTVSPIVTNSDKIIKQNLSTLTNNQLNKANKINKSNRQFITRKQTNQHLSDNQHISTISDNQYISTISDNLNNGQLNNDNVFNNLNRTLNVNQLDVHLEDEHLNTSNNNNIEFVDYDNEKEYIKLENLIKENNDKDKKIDKKHKCLT